MKIGINISSKSRKGERGYNRLNHLREKLVKILRLLEERGMKDVTKLTAEDLHRLFSDMKDGTIKTRYGRAFISTGDYVKDFKTFWHWWMKINAKKGKPLIDITEDLDRRGEKPKFVYFTKEDFEKILLKASYDIKPIISLAFDAGCRVTELLNTRISDFRNDFTEFEIRVWQ